MVHGNVPRFVLSRPALKMLPMLLQGTTGFRRPRRLREARNFQPVFTGFLFGCVSLSTTCFPFLAFSLYSSSGEKSHTRICACPPSAREVRREAEVVRLALSLYVTWAFAHRSSSEAKPLQALNSESLQFQGSNVPLAPSSLTPTNTRP